MPNTQEMLQNTRHLIHSTCNDWTTRLNEVN